MRKTIGGCLTTALAVWIGVGIPARVAAQTASAIVFTANSGGAEVSELDGGTLQPAHADIPADVAPQAVAVSPDGTRLYSGNVATGLEGFSSVTVIDIATSTPLTTVDFDTGDGVSDLVVAPDGSKVYVSLSGTDRVEVLDTVTFGSTEIELTLMAGVTPDLRAIDISTDGMTLFALDVANAVVIKAAAADGATAASVAVSATAQELKVSTDGQTLIVVGSDAPAFFAPATLAPVAGASTTDLGGQVDVAVAGQRAYVLNQAFIPPAQTTAIAPAGGIVQPSVDVYDMTTGTYVRSFMLLPNQTVRGIAVLPDGTRAFVADDGTGSAGEVEALDLADGTIGPHGPTGVMPRRVAVKPGPETPTETDVVSYFLPHAIALKLKGAGKDSLLASGFYDDGGLAVSYTQPVTIDVGGFTRTFTLVQKGKRFAFTDPGIAFAIVPNLKASSRGKFRMRIAKTTLAGLVDPSAAVAFHFRATGLPDARGKVTLTAGRYRLAHVRGALIEPAFFPANTRAKVGGQDLDALSFRGGFASNGQTPAQLDQVRFGFGPTFSRTIAGSQLTKSGDTFTFSETQGSSRFSLAIDFRRELVVVKAKHVELGPLDPPTIDIVFDAGAGTIRNTVRFGTKGATRAY